jgi:DNA-binding FadR family transcriptional regulator
VCKIATTIHSFMTSEKRFFDLVFSLAGNPVLRLFSEVIMDYSLTFVATGVFSKRVDRAHEYATLRNRLGRAILDRDSEVAYTLARRCGGLVRRWMERDKLKHHSASTEVAR